MAEPADTVALVTGASRGFGWSVAIEAARRGHHVVALARTIGGLEELDDAIKAEGGQATLTPLDVTDADGVERMGQALGARFGKLDLWLHCAAQAPALAPATNADPKDLEKAWKVNVKALQSLMTAFAPLLRAAPAGRAVLIDDRREGAAFFGPYAATKSAARTLWTAWAEESARTSLRPLLALPPPMATALRSRFYPGHTSAPLADRAAIARALFDALPQAGSEIDLRALGVKTDGVSAAG
jgi:NAD(P)-dependent dehydrogenase (short-subunit alcohol dehydrogenase family)